MKHLPIRHNFTNLRRMGNPLDKGPRSSVIFCSMPCALNQKLLSNPPFRRSPAGNGGNVLWCVFLACCSVFGLGLVWGPFFGDSGHSGLEEAPAVHLSRNVPPELAWQEHCGKCHMDGAEKGGFDLEEVLQNPVKHPKAWEAVRNQLRLQLMPPPQQAKLRRPERQALISWVEDAVLSPPQVPLRGSPSVPRRLNRTEYNNTLRELLGVNLSPADRFPEEETVYGLDNMAAVQHVPPALMEGWLSAAQVSLAAAFDPVLPKTRNLLVDPGDLPDAKRTYEQNLVLDQPDQLEWPVTTDHLGEGPARYSVELTAYARPAGDAPPLLSFGGVERPLSGNRKEPDHLRFEITLPEGATSIRLGLANPYAMATDPDPHNRFRQAVFVQARIHGPLGLHGKSTVQAARWLAGVELWAPAAPQRKMLEERILAFAEAAVRRPLMGSLRKRLSDLLQTAAGQAESTAGEVARMAMTAILVSPQFLYFQEPVLPVASHPQLLDEYALANRLAYFLWKCPPDEDLRKEAANGTVRANLKQQVHRMLRHPKSISLARDFAGQWLQLRNLQLTQPDPQTFPTATPLLLASMRAEMEHFVHDLLVRRRPVKEFLLAENTFADSRLAEHYGLPKAQVPNDVLVPVSLKGTERLGLLGKAGVQVLTSQPTRTSPVARGKWVLECLLGLSPPPPPPNVPTLDAAEPASAASPNAKTLSPREMLALHRSMPNCVNCHACLDPYGLAMEGFDALGRHRSADSHAELPNGQVIQNAAQLSHFLAEHHLADFQQHLATSMLAYACGHPVTPADLRQVKEVQRIAAKHGDHLAAYAYAVARSVLFQTVQRSG